MFLTVEMLGKENVPLDIIENFAKRFQEGLDPSPATCLSHAEFDWNHLANALLSDDGRRGYNALIERTERVFHAASNKAHLRYMDVYFSSCKAGTTFTLPALSKMMHEIYTTETLVESASYKADCAVAFGSLWDAYHK